MYSNTKHTCCTLLCSPLQNIFAVLCHILHDKTYLPYFNIYLITKIIAVLCHVLHYKTYLLCFAMYHITKHTCCTLLSTFFIKKHTCCTLTCTPLQNIHAVLCHVLHYKTYLLYLPMYFITKHTCCILSCTVLLRIHAVYCLVYYITKHTCCTLLWPLSSLVVWSYFLLESLQGLCSELYKIFVFKFIISIISDMVAKSQKLNAHLHWILHCI